MPPSKRPAAAPASVGGSVKTVKTVKTVKSASDKSKSARTRVYPKPDKCVLCDVVPGTGIDAVSGGPVQWADYYWETSAATSWSAEPEAKSEKGQLCYTCSRVHSHLMNEVKVPKCPKKLRESPHFSAFKSARAQWVSAHILGNRPGDIPVRRVESVDVPEFKYETVTGEPVE